jgi:DNA replication protein DnaC
MSWIDDVRAEHPSQLAPLDLPERYRSLKVATIPDPTLRNCAARYIADFWDYADQGKAPGFFGRSGSYKTWAAACIIERVHQRGLVDSEYVQAGREFARLERERFSPTTEPRLNRLCSVPFLVLDDITDVKANSEQLNMLDTVVKERDATGVLTLYTGNVLFTPDRPEQLLQHFGAPMTRRLIETTRGNLVILR